MCALLSAGAFASVYSLHGAIISLLCGFEICLSLYVWDLGKRVRLNCLGHLFPPFLLEIALSFACCVWQTVTFGVLTTARWQMSLLCINTDCCITQGRIKEKFSQLNWLFSAYILHRVASFVLCYVWAGYLLELVRIDQKSIYRMRRCQKKKSFVTAVLGVPAVVCSRSTLADKCEMKSALQPVGSRDYAFGTAVAKRWYCRFRPVPGPNVAWNRACR